MLFISDKNIDKFKKKDKEKNLIDFLNKKQYRVSDTVLSYRQINALDSNKMFSDERKKGAKGWRKFSFKELVYFACIHELRKFGLTDSQIENTRDNFFKPPEKIKIKTIKDQSYSVMSDIALSCVFSEIQIILLIDSDYTSHFLDTENFKMFSNNITCCVYISLNKIVNQVLEKLGETEISYNSFFEK